MGRRLALGFPLIGLPPTDDDESSDESVSWASETLKVLLDIEEAEVLDEEVEMLLLSTLTSLSGVVWSGGILSSTTGLLERASIWWVFSADLAEGAARMDISAKCFGSVAV